MGGKDQGRDGKGGSGVGLEDFRLWKEFTRDIDPLEEPDWAALEELIAQESPNTKIIRDAKIAPVSKPAAQSPAKVSGPKQKPQLDARTEARLRRGKLPIDGTLDLHGYRQEPAHRLLTDFVLNAYAAEKRCLLVITGKGRSAAGGALLDVPEGVLKQKVPLWLETPPLAEAVLKVLPAVQGHGGSGALYVYLRRKR